ncbi:uncharacterized protein TRIADDRAFT_54006 [Trichoplax adhaerens]|uniref:OBG-type G domain-containing protein n=1 Tax=Trichoplax adhaerens TaxID=10228 RepID=B3RQU9_TRIAD|nr:hypothetical protein TRIADDRAFT_54006 [Trichoplax adhaerens]EDV26228.1 hypothetical protein TRIADDRAFT_54006 [Trichoplax adhaerens]|eukprot:XP_002110224.1 hypothetical protein TRIADDRAFT_54006 [Trichoplax adhaerens]
MAVTKWKRQFVDRVRIFCRGGGGGQGKPRSGAMGGDGGEVYVVAKDGAALFDIAQRKDRRFIAGNGENCSRQAFNGHKGKDCRIAIPTGTLITCLDSKKVLVSLDKVDSTFTVAKGGMGGCPQTGPKWCGLKGQKRMISLELKLIADVGLIGFPNAGKSTTLRALTGAKPKVANYSFTTIRPHLGTVFYPDYVKVRIADLPGLIEGASQNVGMGHKFLKHVERTKLLLFIIDINGFQLSEKFSFRTPLETISLLAQELKSYSHELLKRPSIIAINKVEGRQGQRKFDELISKMDADLSMDIQFQNFTLNVKSMQKELLRSFMLTNGNNNSNDNWPNCMHLCPISAKHLEGIEELKVKIHQVITDIRANQS